VPDEHPTVEAWQAVCRNHVAAAYLATVVGGHPEEEAEEEEEEAGGSGLTYGKASGSSPGRSVPAASPRPRPVLQIFLLDSLLRQAVTALHSKSKLTWQVSASGQPSAKASPEDPPPGLTPEAGCDSIAEQEQVNLAGMRPALGQGQS
jgi:hypothetical protein